MRPYRCIVCGADLMHPERGRPRLVCPTTDCTRRLAAEQKRNRRRALAGFAHSGPAGLRWLPLATGGRDGVLRKQARRMAQVIAPHVTVTIDELSAIESALLTTGLPEEPPRVTNSGRVYGLPAALPRPVWATLRSLAQRNHAAEQERLKARRAAARQSGEPWPGRPAGAAPIAENPAAFARPARARGATSRDDDMGWLGLPTPQPARKIDLPLPEERKPIELPDPPRRRPRSEL